MRIVIVDDEAPARERLKRLLGDIGTFEVVGEGSSGEAAIDVCAQTRPDVVLLDIRMPGMDGVTAARHLTTLDTPPAVIFATAYDEYAIEAFDAQAIGYLLKPVRRERLERVLEHAARLTAPELVKLAEAARQPTRRAHICVRQRDELVLVPIEDILYFRADQKYVTVRHVNGEDLIDESLKSLEEEFEPDFARIHRSTLAALGHMKSIERDNDGAQYVLLRGDGERLPVSRRFASKLKRRLRGSKS